MIKQILSCLLMSNYLFAASIGNNKPVLKEKNKDPKKMDVIVLSSKSSAKIEAVRNATTRVFPDTKFEYIFQDSVQGLPAQPIGTEQTKKCALERAKHALAQNPKARFSIGLESGIDEEGYTVNCAAVIGPGGKESIAFGVRFPLPPSAVKKILKGEEMGPVMESLFTTKKPAKGHAGAIGLLTNGSLNRAEILESPLICAFIPFLHPDLY